MAAATHKLTAEAAVTVRVSQAAPGDLASGARAQLERVDGVRVDDLTIAGLTPGLNDTTVEATATLFVEADDGHAGADGADDPAERVAARLADGFGVDPERVDLVDPPD
ncbi:hypothetical protein JCM17823_19690 [Halorubrum gandharaense]